MRGKEGGGRRGRREGEKGSEREEVGWIVS